MAKLDFKIYVPVENISDYNCYVVFDFQTIRAYKNNLIIGNNDYTDFFYNSHYMSKDGTQVIESIQEMPVCLSNDVLTNDYLHRLDLSHIIVVVSFFLIFILFTFKVFSRLFGRWLKC